jgi:hypothetical protein
MAELPVMPRFDAETGEEINPTGRPHLSASAIERFLGCGYRYYLERVARVGDLRSAQWVLGESAHAAAEVSTRHFLAAGEHLPPRVLHETFTSEFTGRWTKSEVDPSVLREFGTELRARETLYRQGLACVDAWRTEVAPSLTDVVECEWRGRIPLHGRFDLVFGIDLVTRRDGWSAVRNYKFPRRSTPFEVGDWIASDIYALAHAMRYGCLPDEVERIEIRRGRAARVRPLGTTRTKSDVAAMLETADDVAARITADDFQANGAGTGQCHYCSVRAHCEYSTAAPLTTIDNGPVRTKVFTPPSQPDIDGCTGTEGAR